MIPRSVGKVARWTTQAGSLSNLKLGQFDLEAPTPAEVTVEIHSVGLNFADMFACLGLYSATPQGTFTPGLEFSGVVTRLGAPPGVEVETSRGFRVGDRVMGCTRFGGYSSAINIDSRYIRHIPDSWSTDEGASFLAQGLTAWYGLVSLGGLAPAVGKQRKAVLIHSGAGGVGLLAIQIVKKMGGVPIVTVGSSHKVPFLQMQAGLQPSQIIVRTTGRAFGTQLDTSLAALKCSGLDVVFDSLGGAWFNPAYQRLKPTGRMVVYGAGSMTPSGDLRGLASIINWVRLGWQWLWRPKLDPLDMISENKSVMCFNLIWLWDNVDELTPVLDSMLEFDFEPPHVGTHFAFEEAVEALRKFQTGQTVGKVVLQVNHKSK